MGTRRHQLPARGLAACGGRARGARGAAAELPEPRPAAGRRRRPGVAARGARDRAARQARLHAVPGQGAPQGRVWVGVWTPSACLHSACADAGKFLSSIYQ